MVNLYSGTIESNGEYVDLNEATGVTFQTGKDYQIQFFNQGYIREGDIGKGFYITDIAPFTLRYKGGPVFVCSTGKINVNIAE